MARNWWESSRLADEEDNWWESSALADEPRRDAGGGRGFVNPPMVYEPQPTRVTAAPVPAPETQSLDYSDVATGMMGTPAPAPTQGLIQRIGQALRPKSVLDVPYTPTEQERQAEIDRRLSYGAGPIRPEVVAAADAARSARVTGNQIRFRDQSYADRVAQVASEMDRRGERSSAEIIADLNRPELRAATAERVAEEFRSPGEWAVDTLSSVSQGLVSLAQLPTNIIAPGSSLAESLRETQKELQAQESEVAKASREVLRRRVESEDGFLGKYFATVKELVTNPTLTINEGLKQIPMFVAVIGGAKIGSALGGAGVAAAGRAAPTVALADAIGGGALTTAARATGATVGGVAANMVMAGGDAAGNTYETLTDPKKTPLSDWEKNPDYQRLLLEKLTQGRTEEQAKSLIEQIQKDAKNPKWFPEDTPGGQEYVAASKQAIEEIATTKARMAALITAPLGVLGYMGAEAAVVGRGLGRAAADAMTLKGAAKLVGKDIGLEQVEEGGTQLGSNIITSTVKQDQNLLENVPEAMATAAVTSTPFGVLGAYSQYKAAQEQGQRTDPTADYLARITPGARDAGAEFISPQETVRRATDIGPAPLAPGVANFTPPDSPTKQAGLVDIVVPVPGAETAAPLGAVNPEIERQFGLDKLRMGGTNVGTSGAPGGLAEPGGGAGGGLIGGSMGLAGPGELGAAGAGGGVAGVPGADDRQAVPAGGAAGQQAAGVAPAKIWAGRAGDGYMQPEDAQQALPGLQRKYPDLTWNLQQDADGKFFWSGTTKGANLETTAAAAGAAQGQEVQAAGALVGAGQAGAVSAGATATGAAAPTQLPGLESAGLRVAPTAPVGEIKKLNTALSKDLGVTVSPVKASDMNDQQKLASAVARLLGKTLTVVRQETGTNLVPNGMINRLGGKHIYVADNTEDAPLFVAVHEAYHGLPADKRQVLNKALLDTFKMENKQAFLDEFDYTSDKFEEEAPAMIAQVVSKREDFWQDLRTKMGNKEFGEVAKVILSKLNEIVTGAKKQYGDDFVKKYITDIEKARDLLSTAYAESMQAQGLKPDAGLTAAQPMASGRSRIGMDFKDVIKRTPELQAAAAKVQAGEMTAAEYDRLVNEVKPVEPYTSVPKPAADSEIRTALTSDKVERIGVPSRTLKAGDPVGLRLDIPAYSNHGTWVVSVHQQEAGYNAGKSIGYEPVAAATNVTFGVVEKAALNIAAGKPKATIAVIKGGWKPTTPAEAKLKADQALKSKDWVQVGMDPERHSYFYDRKTMEPLVAADEVIQIGPLVLAKNPTYGEKSEFMFSGRSREPIKIADYKPDTDNFNKQQDMTRMLGEVVAAETISKADEFVERYYKDRPAAQVSPEDRLRAEILLRPKMQAAEQVKQEYDQKVLNIAARTGAAGQMLAPIKGIKRAAEKLVEEDFKVDEIKDLLRSTIVVDNYEDALPIVEEIRKEFDVVRIKDRAETALSGSDVKKESREKTGGYADVMVNIRMPNGTVGEIQINTPAMLAAKDNQGHKLYEAAREQPDGSELRREIYSAMRVLYDAVFEAANRRQPSAQDRKLDSEMGAPRAGSDLTSMSSSPESASLKTLPSGSLTYSSPEKEATNSQPGGKESGTFISGSPDEASLSQRLYASNRPVEQADKGPEPSGTVGEYSFNTDTKGRIIVSGDAKRIKFLTKKVANGVVTEEGVRFKGEDRDSVLAALGAAPAVNPDIAREVAEKLGLTPQELASTSLEYQTGLPKDKAFVAPLKGGLPEVVKFLEERRLAAGLPPLDISKPADQEIVAKLIAAETLAAIRSSGNALQWYDETIARTLAMIAVKYPELQNDRNAQMVFRVAMAITSQGMNVEDNLKFTMDQYDAFRRQGQFPVTGKGEDAQAMANNFALVNDLLKEMGPDTLRRFLITPFTVQELRSAGFEPDGELGDEMVLGSSVLGPKIGFGFYSNLNGNFEPVTMDMWFMRTIGRLTGSLRSFDADKFGGQINRFRAAFDDRGTDGVYADAFDPELVALARTDAEAALRLARLVNSAHQKDFKDNRKDFDAGTRKKSQLVYASATMLTSADKSKDAPANGSERRQLRAIVRMAVDQVEKVYGQRIPPAAMQALIWYPEQELYKAMGVKLRVTSQDYAGAALKILKDQGYGEQQLVAAAESGSKRIQQKARRDVARRNQAAGAAARQTGPLEGAERERFVRERYERTQLAKERAEPKRRGVVFEVAPDPNNAALTAAWRSLSQAQRLAISERVLREIVPRVLAQFETDGIIASQVGSYLDDTNPSFKLLLNKGDPVAVAKALGFVLAQDSMMVVSPKPFQGGEKNSALVIEVGDKTPKQIEAIYKKLRQIKVKGEQVIGGQSYANGGMTILNYSSVPTSELAILVDQKLNKAYSILTRDVYAAFPGKEEYDYASETNDGRGSRAVLRQGARALRADATAALERELRDSGVQFSQRARSDAAGGGRDRGVGSQDVRGQAAPSYGTPREGSSSAVGYHYSTQPRTTLSSGMYGTGLRGAEMQRLQGADSRLRQRVYFYIDRGTGITPEAGVGGYAHRVDLRNLYDADEDPLRLQRNASDFNAFETAVVDAGFDGYMVRNAGPSGNAVLLGRHAVPVEQLGQAGRMQTEDVVPPARERVLSDSEAIAANKMLPAGQVTGKRWAELISRAMPEVYARLADSPVWQSDRTMYRSELAKELRSEAAAPMFSNREQRQLPAVSSQQALNRDISSAADRLADGMAEVKAGRFVPKIMLGRLPHVLNMLGARTQDFNIATSIVSKVFDWKHGHEFPNIKPIDLMRAIYRPAMIFKDKDGKPREFELVLPITNEKGAMLLPIKISVESKQDPFGAVLSAYNKRISNDPKAGKEMTLMRRIQEGNLLYVDPMLAKEAMTGRPRGGPKDGVRLNDNFLSWPAVWPTIEKLIQDRRVKTDVDLMKWIGDNYEPESSPLGMADAPAFSKRARTDTPEFKRWFGKSVVVKRNLSFDEAKRWEIDYIKRNKFKPEAVKQREIAEVERMAEEQRGASSGRFKFAPWSSSREEPRVMYHATPEDITDGVFKRGVGGAIYVSPDAAHAEDIGEQKAFFKQFPKAPFFSPEMIRRSAENFPGLNVVPVYVRAENPFDYENKEHAAALTEHLQRVGYKKPPGASDPEGAPWEVLADSLLDMVSMGDFRVIESPEAMDWIKQQGFDSFYMIEPQEEQPVKNLAVFSPNQLKSAIGNSGAYDPENPSISFSKRAAKPKLDADVVSIFKDLDGARGLSLIRAQERVDAHPMAETIRRVNDEFLDILERLDDAGLVKINCK